MSASPADIAARVLHGRQHTCRQWGPSCVPCEKIGEEVARKVLIDFADRMEKALETVGTGDDPVAAYRFVVSCARSLVTP